MSQHPDSEAAEKEAKNWFLARVQPDPATGCWLWQGARDHRGYGFFSYRGKKCRASRFSWWHLRGPFDLKLSICHKCDNPPCVNPEHLFPGSQSENMKDAVAKGRCGRAIHKRREYCAKGLHEMTPENSKRAYPGRQCRECYNEARRIRKRKGREALDRLMEKGKSMKDHDLESIASVMREGLPGGQVDRILQLARLGLWAEEHRKAISDGLDAGDRFYYGAPKFKAALAALPAVGAAPGEREKR